MLPIKRTTVTATPDPPKQLGHGPPQDETKYIYYRLFDADGPMNTRHIIYTNNPSIGRIEAAFIPPPHNAFTLKRLIAGREGHWDPEPLPLEGATILTLYKTISSGSPLEGGEHLDLLSDQRLGSTPKEPVVLTIVVEDDYI